MKNHIQIIDWAGNILFQGHYKSSEVDKVLDANRCTCEDECTKCDGTGYKGDFEIHWIDETRQDNIYELINY